MRRLSPVSAVLIGGVIAGAFDITYAIGFSAWHGVPAVKILQSVASGLLGKSAFSGGWETAALGFVLHFCIAFSAATIFYLLCKGIPELVRYPFLSGVSYGLAIYGVMNLVVLPLSAYPRKVTFPPLVLATGLFVHAFFIGLPISLAVRRALSQTCATKGVDERCCDQFWVIDRRMETTDTNDHPGIIAFPPLIWLIGAVMSTLLHFVIRFRMIASYGVSVSLGIIFVIIAPSLALSALRVMKKAGTNVDPSKPALTIVRHGPYRITRNPMYLALCLLQIALGFFLNDWITLLFVIPLALILHFGVILREERYLEAKFGDQYVALKRTVRRWI